MKCLENKYMTMQWKTIVKEIDTENTQFKKKIKLINLWNLCVDLKWMI